ncbi:MAG TPA: hypothetical protein VJ835_11410 [Fimbriimonadaceae bacterium]|nr:hypothetical protein [Fimbriimonadaceae bacterium]
MLSSIVLATLLAPKTLNILFLGNSHTANFNVPEMVGRLLESPGKLQIKTGMRTAGFLEDFARNQYVRTEIMSGRWNVLVLQGAKLSSSHRYEYDHSGSVELAKLANTKGIKVGYFAEWPRKGWNESDWIMNQYRGIGKSTSTPVIAIPVAFDRYLARNPGANMWSLDGNHSSITGAYLASCTIALWIVDSKVQLTKWRPEGIDAKTAATLQSIAEATVSEKKGIESRHDTLVLGGICGRSNRHVCPWAVDL